MAGTVDRIAVRRWYHDDCTLGRLVCGPFQCFTLELPFEGNAPDVSCIIPGTYSAFKRTSPTNGPCIELRDVPGREYVQIHKGNYTRDILGCILVGDSIRFLDGDTVPDVTNSGATLARLLQLLPDELTVHISDR